MSSVSSYARIIEETSIYSKYEIAVAAKTYESKCDQIILNGMNSMRKIIPDLNSYASPIFNSAYNAQSHLGDIDLKK